MRNEQGITTKNDYFVLTCILRDRGGDQCPSLHKLSKSFAQLKLQIGREKGINELVIEERKGFCGFLAINRMLR